MDEEYIRLMHYCLIVLFIILHGQISAISSPIFMAFFASALENNALQNCQAVFCDVKIERKWYQKTAIKCLNKNI